VDADPSAKVDVSKPEFETLVASIALAVRDSNLDKMSLLQFKSCAEGGDTGFYAIINGFHWTHTAAVSFNIEGIGPVWGGDLNYIKQGMMWTAYFGNQIAGNIAAQDASIYHNLVERQASDIDKMLRVAPWIEYGARYYHENILKK
jgi:hypothetical protein